MISGGQISGGEISGLFHGVFSFVHPLAHSPLNGRRARSLQQRTGAQFPTLTYLFAHH